MPRRAPSALVAVLALAACASSDDVREDVAADTARDVATTDAPLDTTSDTALDTTPDTDACQAVALTVTPVRGALVLALDRSASMAHQGRLDVAFEGIERALDGRAFDALAVGAELFPASNVAAPACYAPTQVTAVGCGLAPTLQLAPTVLGSAPMSDPGSVRLALLTAVQSLGVAVDVSDGTPLYAALVKAYAAARDADADRRAVLLVSDGNASCASVASPSRPGYFDGYCDDWEEPDAVVALIHAAASDAAKPVATYVLGVVGSASAGEAVGSYTTAPYAMTLALSAYAAAGAPGDLPPGCDADAAFSLSGAAPAHPCHIDLSAAADFTPTRIAAEVSALDARAFACRFQLARPTGASADAALSVSLAGAGGPVAVRPRSGAGDACADGCWELSGDELHLLGTACDPGSAALPTVSAACR
ncbi:MAG: hypothetical protein U1F43_26990 [Myxococcota bacterium]